MRDVPAQVVFHQGERQVQACRHPGRRPQPPVPDEDGVAVHGQPGVLAGQLPARPQWLVTRWLVASPAAASRNTPLHTEVTRRAPAPAAPIQPTRAGVVPRRVHAAAARHDQGVHPSRPELVDAVPGVHRQPAAGPHQPGLPGHHLALVRRGSVRLACWNTS